MFSRPDVLDTTLDAPPTDRAYTDRQADVLARKIAPAAPKETMRESLSSVWDRAGLKIQQGVFDQYAAIATMSDKAWKLARMTTTDSGAMEALFLHGRLTLDEEGGIDVASHDNGLVQTLAPLGPELNDFLAWIAGRRARNLREEGRESLFSDEDIDALITLDRGTMADGRNRAAVYAEVYAEFEALHDSVLDIAEKTGLIGSEERAMWAGQPYVPFYRMLPNEGLRGPTNMGGLTGQRAYQKLKGADIPLNDLLQNVLLNWHHLISASLKNQAATASLDAAVELGAAEEVAEATKSKDAVYVQRNGQKVHYEVEDPFVLDALSALNWNGLNTAGMRALRRFKRIFTVGVTASPQFALANAIRDSIHALAVSGLSPNVPGNLLMGGIALHDKVTRAHMLAGGAEMHFGHQFSADPDAARMAIQGRLSESGLINSSKAKAGLQQAIRQTWGRYREMLSAAENVNRAALYQQMRDQGRSHFEASFAARDLMDFSQTGAWPAVRFLTAVVPFLNARLQGLHRAGRAAKQQPGRFAAVTGVVALASIALMLAYRDDERFKALTDHARDLYWHFWIGDRHYRVPKPFEVGLIGTIAERGLEQIVDELEGKDERTAKEFVDRVRFAVFETLAFNPLPQAMRPAIELWANKDFFTGRDIEPLGLRRLSKTERRRHYTSETATLASRAMGGALSPVQVEHVVEGYFGWLGAAALGVLDEGASMSLPERPARRIEDYPLVGRFVRGDPPRTTRYSALVYEHIQQVREVHNDIRHLRQIGDLGRARAKQTRYADQLAKRRLLERVSKRASLLNKQMTRVRWNPDLTADQKRKRLDELITLKNEVFRRAHVQTARAFR